ncbi:hypothetical protein GOV12_05650 [Candidatus Pacearchaeota archaeon]|nr:hypothetical protein [Candidatus Pacearchaeota archaeon]
MIISISTILKNKHYDSIKITFISALLLLIIISAVKFEIIDNLLRFLILYLPAGWMFRSPLKFQLYIPFFLSTLFFLSIIRIKLKNYRIILFSLIILLIIIIPNLFIIGEIHKNLLIPKELVYINENDIKLINNDDILVIRNKIVNEFNEDDESFREELIVVENSFSIKVVHLEYKDYEELVKTIIKDFRFVLLYKKNKKLVENYNLILVKEFKNGYLLYLNPNSYSEIYSTTSHFQKINPTKYKIHISNLKNTQDLTFLESFHREWKLYIKKKPKKDWCNPIEYYNNTDTTECEHTLKFFEGEELSYLTKKPIFDDTHQIELDYANQWTINPQYIKDNFSKDYYTENPDGSINIELILYFKPQSYFYIGLLISAITLILCIIFLILSYIKQHKNNKKEKLTI